MARDMVRQNFIFREREASIRRVVEEIISRGDVAYGVTTGFGKSAMLPYPQKTAILCSRILS